MIISASRRTDIPAFYGDWFVNRLKAGFAHVRNPISIHRISEVRLTRDSVDCIVFWTKNPLPFFRHLDFIESLEIPFYFQFTLTPYDSKIERNLPEKSKLIQVFKDLSGRIGRKRVIWRYDPILVSREIDESYHAEKFEFLAAELSPFTEKCIISFIDLYKKTERNSKNLGLAEIADKSAQRLASGFSRTARQSGLKIETCSEKIDLSELGIGHTSCIDGELIQRLSGKALEFRKDKHQRPECGCAQSRDIGSYNTCRHGCLYCYASDSDIAVLQRAELHDPDSSILVGQLTEMNLRSPQPPFHP
ncbi:MAG: DUF1848 domain-containing protein [Candidatus Wallbacteria bacterium]|nr:DUF1848 domain-containing protein [Candidatus Wallbacteria bacterium]